MITVSVPLFRGIEYHMKQNNMLFTIRYRFSSLFESKKKKKATIYVVDLLYIGIFFCFLYLFDYLSQVAGYAGEEELGEALEGADVVIIPAGIPRKPGMTRDDLFNINAGIVQSLSTSIAKYCPKVSIICLCSSSFCE